MKLVNISIDDVSPHPKSSFNILRQCKKIHNVFPDAKFTLFVPTGYWRTRKPEIATPGPLLLFDDPHAVSMIEMLAKLDTFEICYHGFNHGIPGVSDNDEFATLNKNEAFRKLLNMWVAAGHLRDVFKPIFRPPAWRMSAAAMDAAREFGIKTFALSPDDYAMKTYGGAEKRHDIVYYTAAPPFKPLELVEKTEIVYHACEWDKNYLSDSHVDELIEFLKRHEGEYKFAFIEELV